MHPYDAMIANAAATYASHRAMQQQSLQSDRDRLQQLTQSLMSAKTPDELAVWARRWAALYAAMGQRGTAPATPPPQAILDRLNEGMRTSVVPQSPLAGLDPDGDVRTLAVSLKQAVQAEIVKIPACCDHRPAVHGLIVGCFVPNCGCRKPGGITTSYSAAVSLTLPSDWQSAAWSDSDVRKWWSENLVSFRSSNQLTDGASLQWHIRPF